MDEIIFMLEVKGYTKEEPFSEIRLFKYIEKAREVWRKEVNSAIEDYSFISNPVIEKNEDYFELYEDGEYTINSILIQIKPMKVE